MSNSRTKYLCCGHTTGRLPVKKIHYHWQLHQDFEHWVYNKPQPEAPEPKHIVSEPPKDFRKERLYLLIENPDDTDTLTAIRRLADIYIGAQDVVLVLKDGDTKRPLKMPFHVEVTPDLLTKLKDLLGEANVKVK